MATTRINGCDLYFRDEGSGDRSVVFLPGVWMTSRYFGRQIPFFSERHRTVAFDFRAHGQSSVVQHGHTVAQYGRDLHALLERLDMREVTAIGWSMGCMVIWEHLRQFGNDRLRSMILVGQSASDFRWPDWPHGPFDLARLTSVMAAVQTDQVSFVRAFIPRMFSGPVDTNDLAWMIDETSRPPAAIASTIFFDQTVQDYRPFLEEIRLPTLVCCGAHDRYVSREASEFTARSIPNSRLQFFENSGHCPFLEEPLRFNEVVDSFIRMT